MHPGVVQAKAPDGQETQRYSNTSYVPVAVAVHQQMHNGQAIGKGNFGIAACTCQSLDGMTQVET